MKRGWVVILLCGAWSVRAAPAEEGGGETAGSHAEEQPQARAAPPPPPAVKPRDVERALKEAMDRQAGVVPEIAPRTEVVGGVPTDKLGDSLPEIYAFKVPDVLGAPEVHDGQRVMVRGLVRRTASDGSWMEVAEYKSAPVGLCIRVVAGPGWRFFPSTNDRRLTAYGLLRRQKVGAREARKIDEEAGEKPKAGARIEWRMEARGAEVQWLD